ncbi:putative transaminase [Lupinus albus]|uniref:Putative transaminase n=1 Tax=Lupinus albus TaxID=3870 RepID=A0A6A4P2Y7_LUPAL|nr:putative transaminase [Lupinus albus]
MFFFLITETRAKFKDQINEIVYLQEYQDQIGFLSSKVFQWGGDAAVYDKNEPYIEIVCSPNNPDGVIQKPVVKSDAKGKLIHDFAYYWPQYTPITHKADHDIMLFTFSKCTGHAGSRVGWAIVKDVEVARKMTRFIQLSSIGVARESQTRLVKIIGGLCDSYINFGSTQSELFFHYGKRRLRERWEKLRAAIEQSKVFTAAKFPRAYCNFTNESSETYPGFAWLKCVEGIEDAKSYLRKLNILVREGNRFCAGQNYVRVSLLGPDEVFNELLARLSNAKRYVA